jgi:hypothetical protein
VPVAHLRPTQITVGYREVAAKRRLWRERSDSKADDFLGRHMIPVLLGPRGHSYVIDHHHLARALIDEGVEQVATTLVADLSHLAKDEFWVFVDNKGWCHPYDASGLRRDFSAIPKSVAGLKDDPYRSLAGELRRAGGFAKDTTPFSEFLWADFLRRSVKEKMVEDDFESALVKALKLAKSTRAQHLPGWCGPTLDD